MINCMNIRVDLHCHGPNEWRYNPTKWNPRKLAELVAGKLEAVGIAEMTETDHRFENLKIAGKNDKGVYIDNNQIHVPEYNISFFRTEEISTRLNGISQGHLLIFGNKNKIIKGSLDEVLDIANEQGAVVIADHAFTGPHDANMGLCYANSPDRVLRYFNEGKIHAMEYNGSLASWAIFNKLTGSIKKNNKAVDFAKKHNLYLTASTDAHCISEMTGNRAHTSFEVPSSLGRESELDYVAFFQKTLKTPGNKIVPVMNPGPAFYLDKHVGEIALFRLMLKLGYEHQ